MEADMKRKKLIALSFIFIIFAFTAVIIYGYIYKINKKGDHIIFECSFYNTPSLTEPDRYFALRENNELLWLYGDGSLGNGTYAGYFDNIEERGIIKITDTEREALFDRMKKIISLCEPTESSYNAAGNDAPEYIIKYKDNYFNYCQTVAAFSAQGNDYNKYYNTEYDFLSLKDDLISVISEYKKNGDLISEMYGYGDNSVKVYRYRTERDWYVTEQQKDTAETRTEETNELTPKQKREFIKQYEEESKLAE